MKAAVSLEPRETMLTLLLVAASLSPTVQSDLAPGTVHVVDAAGLGAFTDLPPALAGASPGDVLLVKPGSYSGFDAGIGVTVVADPSFATPPRILGPVIVQSLPGDQTFVLDGFELVEGPSPISGLDDSGCIIWNNNGAVRVQGCDVVGLAGNQVTGIDGYGAARISNSEDVVITESTMRGGAGLSSLGYAGGAPSPRGGDGIVAYDSKVAVHRTFAYGGAGGDLTNGGIGGGGGAGVRVQRGVLYLGRSQLVGGDSGDTGDGIVPGYCVTGGPGLHVELNASVTELGSLFIGGAFGVYVSQPCNPPGQNGPPIIGPVHHVSDQPRVMLSPRVVRGGQQVMTQYFGQAGDVVWRYASPDPTWQLRIPDWGVLCVQPRPRGSISPIGTIGPGGLATVPESWPAPLASDAVVLHLQSIFRSAGGRVVLTNPMTLTVLDPSF